jgi:DNA-binding CsgD family transcriptional regulator
MAFGVVALAQEAPTVDLFERALLADLLREVGAELASFLDARDPTQVRVAGVDAVRIEATSRANASRYARETAVLLRPAGGGVVVDADVFPAARLRSLAYFRDLAVPVGGTATLFGALRVRGRLVGAVVLGRCGRSFDGAARARIAEALPAIALARATYDAEPGADLSALSAREREVLRYVGLGYTNPEIALALGTSRNTVRNQLVSIYAKLGATTRAEAVALAGPFAAPTSAAPKRT